MLAGGAGSLVESYVCPEVDHQGDVVGGHVGEFWGEHGDKARAMRPFIGGEAAGGDDFL